jgi:YVTN family beta-propeller protein
VGSLVSASGSGLAASTAVSFEIGTTRLASNCSTDASGDYPGSTGTPCTFVLPAVPGGNQTVTALGGATPAPVPVGGSPSEIAYDPAQGQIFVANSYSDNVSVIADSNDSVIATLALGATPYGIVFDSGLDEVFVATGGDSITVLNASNDSVLTTFGTTNNPSTLAYDPALGEVLVALYGPGLVDVLSDTNYSTLASVRTGPGAQGSPDGMGYDAGVDRTYVTNEGNSNVTVVNMTSNQVQADIGVGSYPTGVAYDPAMNEVFVAGTNSNNISVIADANDSVVATITGGLSGPTWEAYDPTSNAIWVSEPNANQVAEVSAASNSVVATYGTGSYPTGIAFDTATGSVYVANTQSDNVTVIPTVAGEANFTVEPTLSLVPALGPVGGNASAIGFGFSAGAAINFTFGGAPVNSTCSTGVNGTFRPVTSSPCSFTVPPVPKGSYSVVASDGVHSTNATFEVTPGVVLAPATGPVGTLVAVSGFDFAANASISFTLAGTGTSATCSSDATGDFPGTTGTPCTFTVPRAPGGPEPFTAGDGTNTGAASFTITANLTVTPTHGTVGSIVAGTGTGFPANFAINFSMDGVAASSNCVTDSTGTFPGTSGTPCTIQVPAVPGGLESLVVSNYGPRTVSGAELAAGRMFFDPSTQELFVANPGSNTVTVIDPANNSTGATLPVGNEPLGVGLDSYGSNTDQVLNFGSNNLTLVDGETNTITGWLGVGSEPMGTVYDSLQDKEYVTDYGSDNITIISYGVDIGNTSVGPHPAGVSDDVNARYVFITDSGSDLVSVMLIRNSADVIVANVTVGSEPVGDCWNGNDETFVTNLASDNVSVIDDSTLTIAATIPVGNAPVGIACDTNDNDAYVANFGSDTVSVVSMATDTVIATVPVGGGPNSVQFDGNEVYVANSETANVTIISATTNQVTGSIEVGNGGVLGLTGASQAPFAVNASATVPTASGSVEVGESMTIVGSGFGSVASFTAITLNGTSIVCAGAVVGSCVGGNLTTNYFGSVDANFTVPIERSNGTYTLRLADSAGHTAQLMLEVLIDPIGSISARPASIDVGQSTVLTATATGGTGSYNYTWNDLPAGCTVSLQQADCAPSSAGNYSVTVTVTDSNGIAKRSAPFVLAVYPLPSVAPPTGAPGSALVDAGQSASFTAVATSGSGDYVSYAWTGLPGNCTGSTALVKCTDADLPAGNYSITVDVTDSNGGTSPESTPLKFTVDADPAATLPTASRPSADVGGSVTFVESNPLGPLLQYSWSGLPSGCSAVPTSSLTCTVDTPGTYPVVALVTDSNHYTTTSAPLMFTVFADPTVNLTVSQNAVDVGLSATFNATAAGGSGGFVYDWQGLPTGCAGVGPVANCSPTKSGPSVVRVTAIDSDGGTATSHAVSLAVAPAITGSLVATPTSPSVGESVEFNATGSGGTGALSYAWMFGDGGTATGASASHPYTHSGAFTVILWINDSIGGSTMKTLTVTVGSSSSPVGSSGGTGTVSSLVLGLVVAVAIAGWAVVALLLLTRRRTTPRVPRESPTEPPTTTTSAAPQAPTEDEEE